MFYEGTVIRIFIDVGEKEEKSAFRCIEVERARKATGTPNGASINIFSYDFFEFELRLTGKDSADPTQYTFQHNMV